MGFQSLCGDIMRKVLDYDAGGHGLISRVSGKFCRRKPEDHQLFKTLDTTRIRISTAKELRVSPRTKTDEMKVYLQSILIILK